VSFCAHALGLDDALFILDAKLDLRFAKNPLVLGAPLIGFMRACAAFAERRLLHQMGVGTAFDDFGTGYASLSMLKRKPMTRLKIDRRFITEVCHAYFDSRH
jgi:hypothetical protein